ncbi:hypothetical protein MVES_002907 [Malassezia vespertilionis]|uniref:BZIP domain-containing protein n=1 Tax=Malassezia vespertilionis TaxID=2020962 RepID=A0A2N1J9I3_9BASI|nr:hypothetical protein MVES_002907 [Malassezia vespertilionis]
MRNRHSAQLSREKKKAQIEQMEEALFACQAENEAMRTREQQLVRKGEAMQSQIGELSARVLQLESLLINTVKAQGHMHQIQSTGLNGFVNEKDTSTEEFDDVQQVGTLSGEEQARAAPAVALNVGLLESQLGVHAVFCFVAIPGPAAGADIIIDHEPSREVSIIGRGAEATANGSSIATIPSLDQGHLANIERPSVSAAFTQADPFNAFGGLHATLQQPVPSIGSTGASVAAKDSLFSLAQSLSETHAATAGCGSAIVTCDAPEQDLDLLISSFAPSTDTDSFSWQSDNASITTPFSHIDTDEPSVPSDYVKDETLFSPHDYVDMDVYLHASLDKEEGMDLPLFSSIACM